MSCPCMRREHLDDGLELRDLAARVLGVLEDGVGLGRLRVERREHRLLARGHLGGGEDLGVPLAVVLVALRRRCVRVVARKQRV